VAEIARFLAEYELVAVCGFVLLAQVGTPIPALPVALLAGAQAFHNPIGMTSSTAPVTDRPNKVELRLPPEIDAALAREARRAHKPKAVLLRRALEAYFEAATRLSSRFQSSSR